MKSYNTALMCDIIDVTLFKFNHYDNLIWTKCLNQVDYMRVDEDSIVVSPNQLRQLLDLNFKRDLLKIRAIPLELIHKDANSLYFLDRLIADFSRLKWVKITLSKTRNFSRMVVVNSDKQIKYSFRIVKATLRLNEMFELDQIEKINPILHSLKLIDKDKPYKAHGVNAILNKLESTLNQEDISDEQAEMIGYIVDTLSFKIENDGTDILLVTDW